MSCSCAVKSFQFVTLRFVASFSLFVYFFLSYLPSSLDTNSLHCRVELKSFSINVMTVAPGGTKSNLGNSSAAKYDQMHDWKYYKKYEEGLRARTEISQGPGSTPAEELAKKVVASVLKNNPPAWFAYGQFSAILSILYYAPLWFRDYFYRLVMKC
jgi:hypothetical protein